MKVVYQLARATGRRIYSTIYIYIRIYLYIYIYKADRLVLQIQKLRHGRIYKGKKERSLSYHSTAKKTVCYCKTTTRSFLSVHNVPIRAQATPDTDQRRQGTDPNGPKPDPGPLRKPRLARVVWLSLIFALSLSRSTSISIFTATPSPFTVQLSCIWEKGRAPTTNLPPHIIPHKGPNVN